MSIKDLFNRSSQVVVSSSIKKLAEDAESPEFIKESVESQAHLEPHIDFSNPANFVKYGSAQEYYDKSIKYIYDEYPYDGSLKERLEWRNSATLLDIYLYDNRYPKSTGYAVLASDGWGTLAGSIVNGYGQPASSDYEYINIKGGPNSIYGASLGTSSLSDVFGSRSNIFDQTITGSIGPVSAQRVTNLQTNLDRGVTVEFWLKTGSLDTALTEKQVVFDLWNGQVSSSADYGRLRIELDGTRASSPFMVTVLSGTAGLSTSSVEIGSTLNLNSFSDWGHYAFSFVNSGTNIEAKLYVNGALIETKTTGSNIGEIREDLEANIGALLTGTFNPSGESFANLGSGKLSGSIDEFRFWKTRRTEKQIKRNYFTSNLGAGTNTDTANLDLGVYYKFNEGITTEATTDNIVLDYSGRISNGTWTGYPSSAARNTGSAINSASVGTEELDPIIRHTHPDVVNLQSELQLSGTLWDYENNSSLYYTMPTWIIDEDETNSPNGTGGDLRKLTQIMASYLDNLDLTIGELPKLNMAAYPSSSVAHDGNPDKVFEIYPYIQTAVRSHGLEAPELFSNGTILEYYRNRNETKEFEEDLNTVKKLIYNNIYNNLTDIYKAKGTEKAFRNLIRCFGVGDDVIRLNAYGDNTTYKFDTKRRADSLTTKAINFNHVNNFAGTVYQFADPNNPNSVSYISGSSTQGLTLEDGFPITLEAEVVFPRKIPADREGAATQEFGFLTSSLFGMHTAITSGTMDGTETDLTWHATDNANLQVYAIRDKFYSDDVRFVLTSSVPFPIPELSSSYYQNTYDNQKWNFAVRIKPQGYPQSFASGALDSDYTVEFYGVSYIADRKINEFILSSSVQKQTAENFLISAKRIYVGSHKTNFTGSTLQEADTKITSCRYWFNYLDNETIQNHAIDPGNFGIKTPVRDSYMLESDLASIQVPEIESLALYWDFQTVTGSDNGSGVLTTFDGKFNVEDVSSGSLALTSRYNWLGKILKYQHTGRGDAFRINDTGSVQTQYLYAGKQQLPEIVYGDDNIRVLNQEETEVFTRETSPTKTYYAFEKSMYQVISDEIINYFGSIVQFNNLIGDPINRYRPEYKDIKYLRQFFFERVGNTPDLDKFVEFYKWIDSTLETMLMQLTPASAQFSDGIDNVVESHVLERNKYYNKFPTLEFNVPTPETGAIGINRHLYNWKFGHHPVSNLQSDNCFYWSQRAQRDEGILTSSNSNVDENRNAVLSSSVERLERSYTTPYKYSAIKTRFIHGGINYSEGKKIHFYRGVNFPHGAKTSLGLPVNTLNAYDVDVHRFKDCNDELAPNQKRKYRFGTFQGNNHSGSFDGFSGEKAMPFNIYSASFPNTDLRGYNAAVQDKFLSGSQLVNLHSDGYGNGQSDVPMQGPFTQKFVGGHQSRHVRLNNYDTNRTGSDGTHSPAALNNLDGQYTRPESWRILLGGGPEGVGAIGLTGPDYGGPYPDKERQRAWFFREGTTKRPVNIKNILQTSASVDTYISGALEHGPIGNYEKTYQIVQTSGRSTNNFWFNDGQTDLLPDRFKTNNPKTTNVHTLVGLRPFYGDAAGTRGNTFLPGAGADDATAITRTARSLSNRYEPFQNAVTSNRTVFRLPDRTKQDAVIVERFSSPGGPEISSLGFLDVIAAEKSVYNALPFRNLSVRGSGSGEDPNVLISGSSIRVSDHLGHRRGLRTLAALHAGQFGSDATYGSVTATSYVTSPSFFKTNRNTLFRIEGSPGAPGVSYSTASVFDNFYIQHPIPQNDFQYSWISASFSGSRPIGHANKSGLASGTLGFVSAIDFLTASNVTGASGNPVDFAGLNIFYHVPTGSFNEMSSSGGLMTGGIGLGPTGSINVELDFFDAYYDGGVSNGEHITNGYILHLNRGTAGFSSWKQVHNQYHPLVRQFKKNNTYSIIDPQTLLENQQVARYDWRASKTTLANIFGQEPDYISTQDREVLEYHEPAITYDRYKPMTFEYKGPFKDASYAIVKASYGMEKDHFSNSILNEKLNLTSDTETPANLIMDSTQGGKIPGQLNKIIFSETLYPSDLNIYKKHVRQRTTFNNDFWRDNRLDRKIALTGSVFGFRDHNLSEGTYTSSLWSLDARLDFINTDTPGVKTARHDVFDGLAPGNSDPISGSGTGILQNVSVIFHSGKDGAQPGPPGAQIITASCLYSRPHGLTTGSSVRLKTSPLGTSLGDVAGTLQHRNAVQFSGDAPWDAGKQSGKSPFYDSYDAYAEHMNNIGKGYSILPEYRMSERMEDYLLNGVDKFNDTKLLNLTGALANITNSEENEFYKIYSHSDFSKYFTVAKSDVKQKTTYEPTEITVRCNALLKLLPYDGFYPASRTVQLSRLFSGSYAQNFTLTRLDSGNPTFVAADRRQAAMRAIFAPVIAPGVLYNTIKSGIAVDYPVLTSSVLITASVKASNGTENGADLTNNQSGEDFYIANNYFDYRVPFEALAQPEEYISNISFSDMEPHPSASLETTASWDGNGDNRFKFAMNNFLAETPEFFLQNGNFVSFISSPEENFQKAKANRKYTMKVALRRSFVTTQNQFDSDIQRYPFDPGRGRQNMVMYSRPSAFGPPILGALSGVVGVPVSSSDDLSSTGYDAAPNSSVGASAFNSSGSMFGGSNFGINGPFTPPYYHGGAYVIFEFNPTESKKYTLEEIQSQVTISYHRFPNWNLTGALGADGPMGGPGTFGTASFQVENRAETNSMQISASVNLLGRVSAKDLFKFQNVDLTGGDRWVIQTKFETPILNFIDVSSSAGLTPIGSNTTGSAAVSGGINTRPFGMWHQYGRLPQGEEGVFLEISKPKFRPVIVESPPGDATGPSFTNPVGSAPRSDLSLANLIGFSATSQRLGQVAETKTIREAVVAVPFIEKDNERKFFEIPLSLINLQSDALTRETLATSQVESIQQMIDSMGRYIVPPSFDFISYPQDVKPVTMYIFEFEHELNQQDLVDIWQNISPRIARAFDPVNAPNSGVQTDQVMQTKEITHNLEVGELLTTIEEKLQWMVFKVKQRGKTNYFEKIINTNSKTDIPTSLAGEGLGAALSKKGVQETDFLGGGSAKGAKTIDSEETIGYNWPYDFFSLVELVSIEEDVGFSQPTEQPQATEVDEAVAEAKAFATVQEAIAENLGEPLTQDGVQFDFGDGQKAYANVQEAIADGKNQALTQAGVADQFGVPKQINQNVGNNLSREGAQVELGQPTKGSVLEQVEETEEFQALNLPNNFPKI